jgi:hypothetical protein
MATRHLVARGIGFSPGSARFVVLHGFAIGNCLKASRRNRGPIVEPNRLMAALLFLLVV